MIYATKKKQKKVHQLRHEFEIWWVKEGNHSSTLQRRFRHSRGPIYGAPYVLAATQKAWREYEERHG